MAIPSSQRPSPKPLPVNPEVAKVVKPASFTHLPPPTSRSPGGSQGWTPHPPPASRPRSPAARSRETNRTRGWRLVVRGPETARPQPRPGRCSHLPASPAAALRPPGPPRSDRFGPGGGVRGRGRGTAVPRSSPAPACAPPARSPWGGGDSGAERGPREAGRERGEPRGWDRPKGALAAELGVGAEAEPAGRKRGEVWLRRGWRPRVWRRRRAARGNGGGRGGGAARTESSERRGRRGAKLAWRPGTNAAAAGCPWIALRHGRAPQPRPRSGRLRRGGAHRGAGTRGRRAAGGGAGGRECPLPRPGKLSGGH